MSLANTVQRGSYTLLIALFALLFSFGLLAPQIMQSTPGQFPLPQSTVPPPDVLVEPIDAPNPSSGQVTVDPFEQAWPILVMAIVASWVLLVTLFVKRTGKLDQLPLSTVQLIFVTILLVAFLIFEGTDFSTSAVIIGTCALLLIPIHLLRKRLQH